MNTLREVFERQAGNAGTPDLDIDELVGLGEARLRRRRLTAALGSAAAVILVIALGVGGAVLNRSIDRGEGPTDNRRTTDNDHGPNKSLTQTRPIVYSDVHWVPGAGLSGLSGDSIHVGDRVVVTGSGWIHIDVTDDGVVYATGGYTDDGRVWFTDGGTPEQIGSHACIEGHGWQHTVVTGNSGSLAAWIDCTRAQNPELVVYDAGSGREVVRREIPGCSTAQIGRDLGHEVRLGPCLPHAIIGDHVYLTWTHDHGRTTSLLEFDMSTGRVSKVELEGAEDLEQSPSYLDDIRSYPRSLVIGDSWATGTPTLAGEFDVLGKRLVPSSDGPRPSVFDSVTRRPIRLHLPPGYRATDDEDPVDFWWMQWLDDDTIALVGRTGRQGGGQAGDILSCQLSSGRCELAVPALPDQDRVVPNQWLD